MLCVCLVRLSRASISCVCSSRLSRASISCVLLVSARLCSSLLILPPEQFERFELFELFRIFRVFDSYNYLSNSSGSSYSKYVPPPTHCDALKSISLSLKESPSGSKCLTCTEELECLESMERLKGFEVFGVHI